MQKNCIEECDLFRALGRGRIERGFDGGEVNSGTPGLRLRQVERKLGRLKATARMLPDPRITGAAHERAVGCANGLCRGFEKLNDHDRLRLDPALQTALDKRSGCAAMQNGASSPSTDD